MFSFYDFMSFVSEMIQMFGLLILGIAAGWFTIYAFVNRPWQVQVASILGAFFLAAAMAYSVAASSTGSFAIGFGGAILFWGLLESRKDAGEENAAEEE